MMKILPTAHETKATKSFPAKEQDKLVAWIPSVWIKDALSFSKPQCKFWNLPEPLMFVLIFIHPSPLTLYIFYIHLKPDLRVQF